MTPTPDRSRYLLDACVASMELHWCLVHAVAEQEREPEGFEQSVQALTTRAKRLSAQLSVYLNGAP